MAGMAQAALTTIGTACYGGSDYNLIYDDDDTGHGGGGLVWLDYTHSSATWQNQKDWASGLGASLTVTLESPIHTDIDWTTGWRLPDTVDGPYVHGYEGDPDNDGLYTYTAGYNLANSEMGHLFYTELGNLGYVDTSGNLQSGYGLQNTGDFDNLIACWCWSGKEYVDPDSVWGFWMDRGHQSVTGKSYHRYGLAVRSGQVSTVPLPGAIYLFGSGLIGLASLKRRKQGNRR